MNDIVYLGYLSSPFGLKGEIKVISDLNHLDKMLKKGNKVIIDDNEYIISNSRIIKDNYCISFEGYEDINKINNILKKDLYIKREYINLNDDEYLYSDLIECSVYENDNLLGKVDDILINNKYTYIKIDNLIIPIIPKYIVKIDINEKIIYCKDVGELRL